MADPWSIFCESAIEKGAEGCAIFNPVNGGRIGGAGPNGGVTSVRNIDKLIQDVEAAQLSDEMRFDDQRFIALKLADGILVGKGRTHACAVAKTAKLLIVVIVNGSPQKALQVIEPLVERLRSLAS